MSRWTRGPAEYVASTGYHGPYVSGPAGDICDCYVMSNPRAASTRNGGDSYPIHMQGDQADDNARLIAAAFNAATQSEELGYDGIAAVQALPELLGALSGLLKATSHIQQVPLRHLSRASDAMTSASRRIEAES